jgi:hypothetical protein
VIDLMDALKQSLAKRGGAEERPAAAGAPGAKKPPAKAPKRAAASDKDRKAQAGRK